MTTIFVLTGWGINSESLTPLQKQLESKGYHVLTNDLPYTLKADEWLGALAKELPAKSYWLGYSLGGQLLSALTLTNAEQCLGLITMGSNVSFKATSSWEEAMPAETFNSFCMSYKQAPEKTLRRFFQLVAKDDKQAKEQVNSLLHTIEQPIPDYKEGLLLLDTLDNKHALQILTKPQYHLFAENDALVPISSSKALQALLPHAQITTLADAGHCFAMSYASEVATAIDHFIQEHPDVT